MNPQTIFQCGTVLKDHPQVLSQSKKYPTTVEMDKKSNLILKILPESFDGTEVWKNIITLVLHIQPRGGDWALAATLVVNTRINLYAWGNFYMNDFNKIRPLLLIDKPPIKQGSCKSALFTGQPYSVYNGYSIYDGLEFALTNGFDPLYCMNTGLLAQNGIDYSKIETGTFEEKMKIVNDNKNILEDRCIYKINNKEVAKRTFTIKGIINIGLGTNATTQENINYIKNEIYNWGPVIAGMLLYDNFYNLKDGKIYEGPENNSKIIGGHSIILLGWGKDGNTEYWVAYTCWDTFSNTNGFVKIKTGIKECDIENNVVTCIPDMPNVFYDNDIEYLLSKSNPQLYSKKIIVDPLTFYTPETTKLLQQKKIVNAFGTYEIIPLIKNEKTLIPADKFRASTINNYFIGKYNNNISTLNKKSTTAKRESYVFIILAFIVFILAVVYFKIKKNL